MGQSNNINFPCQIIVNLQDIDAFPRSNSLLPSLLQKTVNPSPSPLRVVWKLKRDC
ncbi:hypothetical protein DAPPUDRAFT_233258 [Daphnia pulex]|uniref:Uncharacterized protein n=1 Tax=Daphnia pulex TaxID=6669 RepID=E9FTM3_DAPPU|nr:hypothetical protein DAPPUDRAFT_233258 [Daphnia pulex]|eukprot:EFX89388.1 hypothetical protein DAPPUDRAFT_233258 [Daphnia pulex]